MAPSAAGISGTPLPKKLGLNEDWSGLKLMVRKEKRESWNK